MCTQPENKSGQATVPGLPRGKVKAECKPEEEYEHGAKKPIVTKPLPDPQCISELGDTLDLTAKQGAVEVDMEAILATKQGVVEGEIESSLLAMKQEVVEAEMEVILATEQGVVEEEMEAILATEQGVVKEEMEDIPLATEQEAVEAEVEAILATEQGVVKEEVEDIPLATEQESVEAEVEAILATKQGVVEEEMEDILLPTEQEAVEAEMEVILATEQEAIEEEMEDILLATEQEAVEVEVEVILLATKQEVEAEIEAILTTEQGVVEEEIEDILLATEQESVEAEMEVILLATKQEKVEAEIEAILATEQGAVEEEMEAILAMKKGAVESDGGVTAPKTNGSMSGDDMRAETERDQDNTPQAVEDSGTEEAGTPEEKESLPKTTEQPLRLLEYLTGPMHQDPTMHALSRCASKMIYYIVDLIHHDQRSFVQIPIDGMQLDLYHTPYFPTQSALSILANDFLCFLRTHYDQPPSASVLLKICYPTLPHPVTTTALAVVKSMVLCCKPGDLIPTYIIPDILGCGGNTLLVSFTTPNTFPQTQIRASTNQLSSVNHPPSNRCAYIAHVKVHIGITNPDGLPQLVTSLILPLPQQDVPISYISRLLERIVPGDGDFAKAQSELKKMVEEEGKGECLTKEDPVLVVGLRFNGQRIVNEASSLAAEVFVRLGEVVWSVELVAVVILVWPNQTMTKS